MMQKRFFHNCYHLPLVVRLVNTLPGPQASGVQNKDTKMLYRTKSQYDRLFYKSTMMQLNKSLVQLI